MQTCSHRKHGNKDGSPLEKNSPQLKHYMWSTQSHGVLPPELHTYRHFNLGLDLSLHAHRQCETGKTAKGCELLKTKFSVNGHFLNIANQNTAGKKNPAPISACCMEVRPSALIQLQLPSATSPPQPSALSGAI